MKSNFISFPITDFVYTKQQVLSWLNQFSTCCFLDNHQYQFNHHSYECIAGAGATDFIELPAGNALNELHQFQQKQDGWLFGHLSYDLKNEVEDLGSGNADHLHFPDLFFFSPETILLLNQTELCISASDAGKAALVFASITAIAVQQELSHINHISFQQRFSKQEYIETIEKLRSHILQGDCYEINFCQEFFAENAVIDPVRVYQLLSIISPSPFAAFYKLNDKYLLCASPERYLKKEGRSIISQPIKGTGRRNLSDAASDALNKTRLFNSSKDRSGKCNGGGFGKK